MGRFIIIALITQSVICSLTANASFKYDSSFFGQQKSPIFRWVRFSDLRKTENFFLSKWFKSDYSKLMRIKISNSYGKLDSLRFQEYPQYVSNNEIKLQTVAYFSKNRKKGTFIKADVFYNIRYKEIQKISITKIVPLKKTSFIKARIGLTQLKMIVNDKINGITILYPIGGPALDLGKTDRSNGQNIFTTPTFTGTINRSTARRKRTKPSYYKGKPFIRFIPEGHSRSLFGLHISPWTDYLERGFVSAGCLRMKEDDLYEFFRIVKYGGTVNIPFTIRYTVEENDEHPFEKILDEYEIVHRARWTPSRDRERFRTKRVKGAPPINSMYEYEGYFWP